MTTGLLPEAASALRYFAVPLTVTRPATEAVSGGYVTRGTTSVSGVKGHMQPQQPKERRYNPEGLQNVETWNVWALSEIRVGDKITDGANPTVTIEHLEHWKESPHWKGIGVRVEDDTALPAP